MSFMLIEGLLSRYDNINPINIRMIYSNLLLNLCNATFSKQSFEYQIAINSTHNVHNIFGRLTKKKNVFSTKTTITYKCTLINFIQKYKN